MDKIERLIFRYEMAKAARDRYTALDFKDLVWCFDGQMEAYAVAISILTDRPFPALAEGAAVRRQYEQENYRCI